ncbi:transcriptional regulator domain-containing protein [Bradyrhizobium sp. CCBAU 51753]|uniref:transcriptional regulator domain-containing protein n=1 Tax=Bradyrhizobium sp. CCBAU 51753 TaxID=1325100 RepID=UPI00188BA5F0|nr:DUF6499 domain-containing protein [Bradyrhizobium sp. CCBAU 51753]QOZ23956.1 hypothetical protein XH93_10375 [Bradyrhizobium sp. CCBAU 51753]
MAGADWRSEQAYPDARKAEAMDLAWERLRRDRGYQPDYKMLLSSNRSSMTADHFRRKWGLSFRG